MGGILGTSSASHTSHAGPPPSNGQLSDVRPEARPVTDLVSKHTDLARPSPSFHQRPARLCGHSNGPTHDIHVSQSYHRKTSICA